MRTISLVLCILDMVKYGLYGKRMGTEKQENKTEIYIEAETHIAATATEHYALTLSRCMPVTGHTSEIPISF